MILYLGTIDKQINLKLYDAAGGFIDQFSRETEVNHSVELLLEIEKFLKRNKSDKTKLTGLVVAKGPGFYTGLRVGITAANAMAFALNIPIVGAGTSEDDLKRAILKLLSEKTSGFANSVVPFYDRPPNITQRKH